MIIEITDQKTFDNFANHVTQSWEWGEFRKTTPSIKKVLRLGSGSKVWQIFFSKVPYLSSKTVAYLPRAQTPNTLELIEIQKYCKGENAVFLKMEPLEEVLFGTAGKSILPQHTIYVNLTLSEEKLLEQMHEKTRYNIRLAQKKSVVVKEENSNNALEGFIKLLEETERRQGFYSHTGNYYRKLWQHLYPAKMAFLLNAYADEKLAASIMLFRFKDFLYYPYGGSDYELRQFMAPQLLHFEAMKLGKSLGCETYDLWGSFLNAPAESDPWWGFYRLKSGLGGKEITFPNSVDIPLSLLYRPLIIADDLRWKVLQLKKKV